MALVDMIKGLKALSPPRKRSTPGFQKWQQANGLWVELRDHRNRAYRRSLETRMGLSNAQKKAKKRAGKGGYK